jgi:hypothetical protein
MAESSKPVSFQQLLISTLVQTDARSDGVLKILLGTQERKPSDHATIC